jgi:hypothetical protein
MLLYKYAKEESGIKILDDLRLKVTPPNELNDPFELTPCSRNAMTRKLLLQMLDEDPEHFRPAYDNWVKAEGAGQAFATFLELGRTMSRKLYSSFLERVRQGLIEADLAEMNKTSDYMVILSFSATSTSIPMWSHYANHHKGIVIGFDTDDKCFQLGPPLQRVKYRATRVTFHPLEPTNEEDRLKKHIEMVTTKSPDWAHEKEYRFCYAKDDVIHTHDPKVPYLIAIWPRAIRTVALGCWIRADFEAKIRNILALKRFSHVKLLRTTRHKTHFKLDLVPA